MGNEINEYIELRNEDNKVMLNWVFGIMFLLLVIGLLGYIISLKFGLIVPKTCIPNSVLYSLIK